MKKYAVLMAVDYTKVEKRAVSDDKSLLDTLYEMIGCEYVEVVYPVLLKPPYVMIVDEEGMMKDRPMLNVLGSFVYGMQDHGSPIVGNAVIMKEVMTDDGANLGWLTEEEADNIESMLMDFWPDAVKAAMEYAG